MCSAFSVAGGYVAIFSYWHLLWQSISLRVVHLRDVALPILEYFLHLHDVLG